MRMIKINKENESSFIIELDGESKVISEEFVIGLYDFMLALYESGVDDIRIRNIISTITQESMTRFDLYVQTEDIM